MFLWSNIENYFKLSLYLHLILSTDIFNEKCSEESQLTLYFISVSQVQ